MTVAATPRTAGPFAGNDVTTAFPFTFKVFTAADVGVYVTTNGVQTLLGSGYTVALNADQDNNPGGTVTYPAAGSPLATGSSLAIAGASAYVQTTSLANASRFPTVTVEGALDYLTFLVQQLDARGARTISWPVGETVSGTLPTLTSRAGKILGFDAGNGSLVAVSNPAVDLTILNQPGTNLTFPQDGAKIQRVNDRLMVGGATVSDLLFPNVIKDWMSTFQATLGVNGSMLNAQSAVLTSNSSKSAFGFIAGSQSLYFTSASAACVGTFGFALNNSTGFPAGLPTSWPKAYAFYGEVHRTSNGQIIGIELDTRTTTASILPHPGQQGDVTGIQLGSGAGVSAVGQFDGSAALQIVANPMRWKKAINIMHDALVGSTNGVGESCAFALAMTQNIEWFTSAGVRNGFIKFNTATATNRTGIISNDTGFYIVGNTEQPLMLCANIANAVNYPQLVAGITGNPAALQAVGTDPNVDLRLRTQGTGVLRFGTYTASGDVVCNGSILIRDDAGNLRKIMTTA